MLRGPWRQWPRSVQSDCTQIPGLEEDQRREAGLRPHRLWRDGLHRPSHRRISGDVLSRRRCSVLGDRGTLDRQAPEGACRDRRAGRSAFGEGGRRRVLSQWSNFVVHRIQNPDDLSQMRQMTPFISDAVLKRLPSLPKQHALVFGTSVNLPTTFKVREASPRPHSDDTKVVDLWFHEEDRLATIRLRPPPPEP